MSSSEYYETPSLAVMVAQRKANETELPQSVITAVGGAGFRVYNATYAGRRGKRVLETCWPIAGEAA